MIIHKLAAKVVGVGQGVGQLARRTCFSLQLRSVN